MQGRCKALEFVLLSGLIVPCALSGGSHEDAVGVCAHEMGDPQLALFLCNLLGGSCMGIKSRLLHELIEGEK